MKDNRPKALVHRLMQIRRRIETSIGQLSDYFSIEKMYLPGYLASYKPYGS